MRSFHTWSALSAAWPALAAGLAHTLGTSEPIWGLAVGGVCASLVFALPLRGRVSRAALFAAPAAPLLALGLGPLSIAAAGLTVGLGLGLRGQAQAFDLAVARVTELDLGDRVGSFGSCQSQMSQELRRARRHGRPLSLLTVHLAPASRPGVQDRLIEEAQQRNAERLSEARLARLIGRAASGGEVLAQRNDHLVLLLPETDVEAAARLAHRVEALVEGELGAQACVGSATFPEEELTLDAMLHRATAEMRGLEKAEVSVLPSRAPGLRTPVTTRRSVESVEENAA